ncbi:MAG: hypothetical protein KDC79_05225 [Cyclobacteriaceae bacterium]|nr:hypothetical protein [Cyclobacteriaceae bacterium]
MKKNLLFVLAFSFVLSESAFAQVEVNAFGGYMPGSKTAYSYNGYRLRIDGGGNFGVALDFNLPLKGIQAEVSYMHFSSTLKQDGGLVDRVETQPIIVEYYQIGGLRPLMDGGQFMPFGLFTLGASRFAPENAPQEYWRFAINAGLGMKYFFTDKVGIRLQARLLMPLYFAGAGFGCSIGTGGSGCGTGVGFGTEILQGDFTGGVVLKLGQE